MNVVLNPLKCTLLVIAFCVCSLRAWYAKVYRRAAILNFPLLARHVLCLKFRFSTKSVDRCAIFKIIKSSYTVNCNPFNAYKIHSEIYIEIILNRKYALDEETGTCLSREKVSWRMRLLVNHD